MNLMKENQIILNILNKKYDIVLNDIITFSLNNNLTGNIYHKYILYTLIYNDNPFTRYLEMNNNVIDYNLIIDDLNKFYILYNLNESNLTPLYNFNYTRNFYSNLNEVLTKLELNINNKSNMEFNEIIVDYYIKFGLGDYALYKAFRIKDSSIVPITSNINTTFDDLIGYDMEKEELISNTLSFLKGNNANNVLLYGDSGTGKSTMIKALLNTYYINGLRMVEVYKHELKVLPVIIEELAKRPYYFIIYMDDLSFDEDEVEYKYLKSIIEGRLEDKPSNILIYATSNRRHLIKETFNDNKGEEISRNEAKAEKLSLAYRFGLRIFFSSLNLAKFKEMVKEMARRNNIVMEDKELFTLATRWQMTYGELTGRTANQFIRSLIGNQK